MKVHSFLLYGSRKKGLFQGGITMRKRKLLSRISMATMLCGAFAGCSEKNPEPEITPGPTDITEIAEPTLLPTPTEIPCRDLGGMEIIIGDHWTPEMPPEPCVYVPPTARELYEEAIMEKYNFTLERKAVAGWGEMEEAYIESVQQGEPIAHLVDLDYRFLAKPLSMGLFYDLATLDEFDFSEEKWNSAVREGMTFGSSIYGMRSDVSVPAGGIIFNKRVFEEAGLDPNLPYDLQAAGEWTWSKFEELCGILTRDTNGDGRTDVYATVSQGAQTIQSLVFSTGEDFIVKDAEGIFHNNLSSKNVTDAIDFALELYKKGYEMPQPEDTNWDYFTEAFVQEKAAMQFNELWMCEWDGFYGKNMEEELGFVMPPKPDGAKGYYSYANDTVLVIPSCYDEKTASDIAFAYNLFSALIPEDKSRDKWKYRYMVKDERIETDTLDYVNDGKSTFYLTHMLAEGIWDSIGPDLLWLYPFKEVAPEAQIREIAEKWEALLEEANRGREDKDAE